MSRAERRRWMRQARRLSEQDCCSTCGRSFDHGDISYFGRRAGQHDDLVMVGGCCRDRLATVEGSGLELHSGHASTAVVERAMRNAPEKVAGERDVVPDLAELQAAALALDGPLDEEIADMKRRAGYPDIESPVHYEDTPWKGDDRAFFEANPTRSHRARLTYPGENDETPPPAAAGLPMVTLVRQIVPGRRMRTWVWIAHDQQSLDALSEDHLHWWFDAVMRKSQQQEESP